ETSRFDGMLFPAGNDPVIAVTKIYLRTRIEQFTWPDGSRAHPFKLFPDLHLGFFVRVKNLTSAKWSHRRYKAPGSYLTTTLERVFIVGLQPCRQRLESRSAGTKAKILRGGKIR